MENLSVSHLDYEMTKRELLEKLPKLSVGGYVTVQNTNLPDVDKAVREVLDRRTMTMDEPADFELRACIGDSRIYKRLRADKRRWDEL